MGLDVPKERDNSFYIKASVNQIAKQLGADEFTKEEVEQIVDAYLSVYNEEYESLILDNVTYGHYKNKVE